MLNPPLLSLLLGLGCLLQTMTALAADIQVSVDRNPVGINQSFKLIFTANGDPDADPDFSPLERQLEILNQQRSSNSSWVNGQSSRSEQWILNVLATQSGELMIPSISFGADHSKPLKIKVIDTPQTPQSQDEIFLQVEATPEKAYVQSQIIYTLKLYRRVQITQASLGEPEIRDALVEKLGEDNTYATQSNGVDYWVTERKYAIFPQQSGLLTIAPLTLTAEVLSNQRPSFNGFFSRQLTETRRVKSKALSIAVMPVPQAFTAANWLSAESLALEESWSDDSLQVKVGEPLTRTVRLTARGATVGQLPELVSPPSLDGLKTYPDQPLLKEDKLGDGINALREEKIAYIPSQAGDYRIPAIDITWYDAAKEKVEHATLPALTIHAIGTVQEAQVTATKPVEEPSQTAAASHEINRPETSLYIWQALSAFLAIGWLMTWIWSRRQQPRSATSSPSEFSAPSTTSAEKKLRQACLNHDPQAAKHALLIWGKSHFDCDSLTILAPHCPEPLAQQILHLNHSLYAQAPQPWQGQALWQAFEQRGNNHSTPPSRVDDPLEPLYKL